MLLASTKQFTEPCPAAMMKPYVRSAETENPMFSARAVIDNLPPVLCNHLGRFL